MPYSKWDEINPSLKGIKPKISLEQANAIARQAEAIGSDEEKNGWAIAISNFKKSHTVRAGKWIKREEKGTQKEMSEIDEKDGKEVNESDNAAKISEYDGMNYIPTYNCTSFTQLSSAQAMDDMQKSLKETVSQFNDMVSNIMWNSSIPDKMGALQTLWSEFTDIVSGLIDTMPTQPEENAEEITSNIAESMNGVMDVDFQETEGQSSIARMNVQIIHPGWGNIQDNNYYPAEMLKACSSKFVGAKMFETDHKQEEKSTRTWVSTIESITGFSDTGAPIARVAVHDPGFAERIRNLNELGQLSQMECSIMASGKARGGFEMGGRKGKIVESIDAVSSVDWVTRAGAGGKALGLVESQNGATINEGDNEHMSINEHDVHEQVNQETQPNEPTPKMEAGEVEKVLQASRLPEPSRVRLAESEYADANELNGAIAKESEYIKELTGSGLPFGMTDAKKPLPATTDLAEVEKKKNEVARKWLTP